MNTIYSIIIQAIIICLMAYFGGRLGRKYNDSLTQFEEEQEVIKKIIDTIKDKDV
jgi:hypothetical protein